VHARLRRTLLRPFRRRLRIEIPLDPRAGVNVVGYFRAELGVGEIARRIADALRSAGVPCSTVGYSRTISRQEHSADTDDAAPFDVNVICVNADQLPLFVEDVGRRLFSRRRSVGVWFWEVERFPTAFHRSFEFVDEVWAASEYVRCAFAAVTDKPTRVVPIPIVAPGLAVRPPFELPAEFVFLFSFDFQSVFERKNPLGAIHAFEQTFDVGEGAALLVKTINGHLHPEALERLRTAAKHPDVQIVDGYVSPAKRDALTAACGAYISLHRSEGFGLTIAEAMAAGKPAIATAYSGNLEFMTEENSYLVPYEPAPVPPGAGPYPEGAQWADPDLDRAAEMMRCVFDDRDEAATRGRRGRDDVLARFSPERCAAFVAQRSEALRSAA
jgi:glycosyltransferase involved in cell wall biosynthesis